MLFLRLILGCKKVYVILFGLIFNLHIRIDEVYYKLILEIHAELRLKHNTLLRSTNF